MPEDNMLQDLALKMHSFYANEAHQQRSMMWETVKWFSPLLTAIHTAWFLLYRATVINLITIG